MSENNYGVYILYASGEIILVVVGILLALQIDNWNNNRIDRVSELSILEEIHANLTLDLEDFEINLMHFQTRVISNRTLLDVINSDGAYHDSLGYFYFYLRLFPHFTPNLSGYLMLQSRGLDIISNDSIRKAISSLYETNYNHIRAFERDRYEYTSTILEPAMASYKGTRSLSKDLVPESLLFNTRIPYIAFFRNMEHFDKFKMDTELHGIMKDVEDMSAYLIRLHSAVKTRVLELSSMLGEELKETH